MSSCDCFKRHNRRRTERLHTAAVFCGICAFFTTFLTLDFFGTLLALVAFILVASTSCHSNRNSSSNITLTSVAACFLSFMTCGVAWWTVLAIIITTICDEEENENDGEDASGTNSSSIFGFTNFTTNETDSGLDGDGMSSDENDENVDFFCNHKGWILAFTIISAICWTLTGTLVLIQILQPPPPVIIRRQQGREDDATVETMDDQDQDDEWSDHHDGQEAVQGQIHVVSMDPHESVVEQGTREGHGGELATTRL